MAQTNVVYFDLAVDESRQLLYGSDRNGESIHVVSMTTLNVISTVNVGSQPTGLDISPEGDELAVSLTLIRSPLSAELCLR
jgi:DNA-binding beta-propeller fold protein YncE